MTVALVSISSKNIHKPIAPWYLKAYCEIYNPNVQIDILEYNINESIWDITHGIYATRADIIGFSCYIWNIEAVGKAASLLRLLLPESSIVLGGPEVSYDSCYPFADYIVQGAGEQAFSQLLMGIETGMPRIIQGASLPLKSLPSPFTNDFFESFSADKMGSIKNQLIYFESMRGCPFSCAYCLSSVEQGVDCQNIKRVKSELTAIVKSGAKCIKFIDRTFNSNKGHAKSIFRFILSLDTDCTFHFEAAADLFDDEMISIISQMPKGRVQFEIGIQSVNAAALEEVSRKTDTKKVLSNIFSLVKTGRCEVHADLIAGLPFDTLESFSKAIDSAIAVRPHALHLGFLKLLKGSRLRMDAEKYGYRYSSFPPYQVLKSKWMSAEDLILLKDIERVIDKFYNTGKFKNSIEYSISQLFPSPFKFFKCLASFCKNKNIKLSLKNSYTLLLRFLTIYGDADLASHVIKLDCLTFDSKGQLPDSIDHSRDKEAEAAYRANHKGAKFRIEYFPYDGKTRLFTYE